MNERKTTRVVKKLCTGTDRDLMLRELERAWKEIGRGQARRVTREQFLEELDNW